MSAVDQLFGRRTVLLAGALDAEIASRAAAEFMTLDALGDDHIDLWVNCTGGTLDAALMVMDVIDLLAVPVHATCLGRADGAAIGVLAVADRRAAAPHSQLRFDAPSTTVAGRVGDLVTAADDLRRCRNAFCTRVARAAGQTPGWIDAALRERRTFEPVEALRAGLIDAIAAPRAATVSPFPNVRRSNGL